MKRYKQSGITLIEMTLGLFIFGLATLGIVELSSQQADAAAARQAAQHMRLVGNATKDFVADNFAVITGVATAATPVKINIPTLVVGGYLPLTFNANNINNQTLCALALQITPNKLSVLVVATGGAAFSDFDLQTVSHTLGASGGGIYEVNPAGPSTNIIGDGGSYNFPRGNYHDAARTCLSAGDGGVNLVMGHPVLALWFDQADYASGVLYREAVPGRPELNQMNTDLDLNDFSIVGLESVTNGSACATQGGLAQDSVNGGTLACQSGSWVPSESNFWKDSVANFAALPACNAGVNGSTRVVLDASDGVNRPRAYTCSGGTWRPQGLDDSGDITIPGTATIDKLAGALEVTTVAVVGVACSPSGSIAIEAGGSLLSCAGGAWDTVGSSGAYAITQNDIRDGLKGKRSSMLVTCQRAQWSIFVTTWVNYRYGVNCSTATVQVNAAGTHARTIVYGSSVYPASFPHFDSGYLPITYSAGAAGILISGPYYSTTPAVSISFGFSSVSVSVAANPNRRRIGSGQYF